MLEVSGLTVSYGRHRALEGASVKVAKGEICVILGANGAGKSTLLKAIAGMVRADAGEIAMNGRPIARKKPHLIVEDGIALVPEGRGIFGDLTVAENLQLGAFAARARSAERTTLENVYGLFPRLAERKGQIARTMSGGEQQMVAIGRALMSRPDILMLDEPSLGLSPLLTQELFKSLTAVAATGVGILLVEQNARQSLKIARRGYLIENGHVTGENSAEALRNDPAVIAAYLGGAAPAQRPTQPAIALPPGFALPARLEDLARSIGRVAARAGAISSAFVRAARRDAPLPSAFVGRFDPKAGGDPWNDVAAQPAPDAVHRPRQPSREAAKEAGRAALLSERAAERLARHIALTRLNAPLPSAFARREDAPPQDAPLPAVATWGHGLIGHNSAGVDLDSVETPPVAADIPPQRQPGQERGPTIADLAARAAAIQAAHVAESRRRLTAFVVPAAPPMETALRDVAAAPVAAGPVIKQKPAGKRKKKHRKES